MLHYRTTPHPSFFILPFPKQFEIKTDMSLAAELVDKLRALGLPESYDAILLDEGTRTSTSVHLSTLPHHPFAHPGW